MNETIDPNAAGTNAVDESLSMEALIGEFAREEAEPQTETTEDQPEGDEPEQPDEVDDTPPETTEDEPEDEPAGEGSGINLDNLTPEQWEEVRTQLKSKAAKEFPEYRRKLKEKDELIARLQEQTPKPAQPQPAESPLLKGVENAEQLAAKVTELQDSAEAIEALLDDHEGYAADDIIEYGGRSHKKSDWKQALRNIRRTLDKAVPYKQSQFQQKAVHAQQEEAWNGAAKKQVPEAYDEATEVGKRFKAMREDPLLKEVREKVPGIAPQLEYLLAHSCRSLFGSPTKPNKAAAAPPGTTQKAKPPASPAGGAATTAVKPGSEKEKRIQAAQQRYEKNPTQENLIALEMAEQS